MSDFYTLYYCYPGNCFDLNFVEVNLNETLSY